MAKKGKKTTKKPIGSVAISVPTAGGTGVAVSVAGDAPAQAGKKARRPRHTADWVVKPFAVIIGKSMVVKEQFASLEEAKTFIGELPYTQRARVFVGKFAAIDVKTTVNIPEF